MSYVGYMSCMSYVSYMSSFMNCLKSLEIAWNYLKELEKVLQNWKTES